MLDLSIIIVSYNTKKLLAEAIDSVVDMTRGLSYEIIVIDNASTDGSIQFLKKLVKTNRLIKIILNETNLGFGHANNRGLKIAKGRYLLLLNSDTILKTNLLPEMVKWLDENKQIGVTSCALKNSDNSYQGTGGYFPTLCRVFTWMSFLDDLPFIDRLIKPFHPMHSQSFFNKNEKYFAKEGERDWVSGAFFLFRHEIINQVGYFDSDYFMYTEEVDYCFRIKQKGWKIWYLPHWSIVHYGGASSSSEFAIISEYKGISLFYRKHRTQLEQSLLKVFLKMGSLLRIVVFSLLNKTDLVKIYAKITFSS